jgi:hypothetical protein
MSLLKYLLAANHINVTRHARVYGVLVVVYGYRGWNYPGGSAQLPDPSVLDRYQSSVSAVDRN